MKTLKVTEESKCTGCQLCALACSRMALNTVSLESSYIKVSKSKDGGYKVVIDVGKVTPELAAYIAPYCPEGILEVVDA